MARRIAIRNMLFHNYNCMATAIPKLRTEIQSIPADEDISWDNVTEAINPRTTDTVEDEDYGTIVFPVLRCSNPACNVSQKNDASKEGWIGVRLF